MSFIPLEFGKVYKLSSEEISPHGILPDGTSRLYCYNDSHFTVTYHRPSKQYGNNHRDPDDYTYTQLSWTVVRLHR